MAIDNNTQSWRKRSRLWRRNSKSIFKQRRMKTQNWIREIMN